MCEYLFSCIYTYTCIAYAFVYYYLSVMYMYILKDAKRTPPYTVHTLHPASADTVIDAIETLDPKLNSDICLPVYIVL